MRIKKSYLVLLFLGLLVCAFSCKKSSSPGGLASLKIINASVNAPGIYFYNTFSDSAFYQEQAIVNANSSLEFGLPMGSDPISLIPSSDTLGKPWFKGTLTLKAGSIYSLFLAGVFPSLDTVFTQDIIPVYSDSAAGARFINLCPDCGQVNIMLQGNTQNEFNPLGYKQITSFKQYSDNSNIMNNGGYNYQVTDGSGNPLTTFNWNPQIYKNNTLVISGLDRLQSVQVFQVTNY